MEPMETHGRSKKNSSTRDGARSPAGFALPIAALIAALIVAGCGAVKLGYRNADMVGPLWLNRYLDLDSAQNDLVRHRIAKLLVWHRATQLPDYARLLGELQRRVDETLIAADVAEVDKQMMQHAQTTIEHALPELADLALTLKPEQMKTLQNKFADNDDKFRSDYLRGDTEKRQKIRYEKALDRAEEWYGRFDRQQRAAIRRASDARPLNNEFLLAERQRRETELVTLLSRIVHEKPSRDAVIALLKAYYERFEVSPDRERRAFQLALSHGSDEMNAAIANLATREQRAHAVEKLQQWIDDCKKMAAAPG